MHLPIAPDNFKSCFGDPHLPFFLTGRYVAWHRFETLPQAQERSLSVFHLLVQSPTNFLHFQTIEDHHVDSELRSTPISYLFNNFKVLILQIH